MKEKLSTQRQIAYSCGMLGISILMNIISVMLIYVYVPPENSNLVALIPQITFLGIFSILSLIVASGRLFDAITDPLIAFFSDTSQHKRGRRIPFMTWALLPCVIFCILIFIPHELTESTNNLWQLVFVQLGFYFTLTIYVVPYNALLPELATTKKEQIRLSTCLSAAYVFGIIFSSQTPLLADVYESYFKEVSRNQSIQYAIASLSFIAMLFMLIPIIAIDEAKHCVSQPLRISLGKALRQTLSNKNFMIFIIAETFYFIALTMIVSGLLYYLRVLLQLEESLGGYVMGTMVLVSLFYYPFMVRLVEKFGERRLILFAFFYLGILLIGIFFMGKYPIGPRIQIFGFAILAALPLAFLGILPFAIIAEIATQDTRETGRQKEAMFFAVRNLLNKFGQTLGIMIFAILTLYGKDPGDDLGIRLSGLIGGCLCLLAVLAFLQYRGLEAIEKE